MRAYARVALLAVSTCWAQEPASIPHSLPSPVTAPAPAAAERQTITIPAGTRIPLSLASQVSTKSRPGDAVRAVTGFPVTVGTRLAIPVGTYVEGVLDKVTKGGRSGPSLQMHFTRILFSNGYGVAVDGASTQARVIIPPSDSHEATSLVREAGSGNAFAADPSPGLPTLQPLPSHTGLMVGVGVAGAAAVAVLAVLGHHHYGGSGVLFDTGWQFEMVLTSPLSVDAASVAAAAATGNAH